MKFLGLVVPCANTRIGYKLQKYLSNPSCHCNT